MEMSEDIGINSIGPSDQSDVHPSELGPAFSLKSSDKSELSKPSPQSSPDSLSPAISRTDSPTIPELSLSPEISPRSLSNTPTLAPSTPSTNPSTPELKHSPSVQSTKPKTARTRKNTGQKSQTIRRSSPNTSPQFEIYHNLLILEQSFRSQFINLRQTRRKYMIFFSLIMISNLYFAYAVFINQSIYEVIQLINRLALLLSLVTLGLFYLTGLYTRTFVLSRRFFVNSNRGLRGFNMRLAKIPPTWTESIIDLWYPAYASRPGRLLKTVLSSRAFAPEIVEGWEIYRQEFWDKETERKSRPVKKVVRKKTGAASTRVKRSKGNEREPAA